MYNYFINYFEYFLRGNCHPDILAKVRQYYSIPEFLPEDAEFPATENIFFGYEIGAVMHVGIIVIVGKFKVTET